MFACCVFLFLLPMFCPELLLLEEQVSESFNLIRQVRCIKDYAGLYFLVHHIQYQVRFMRMIVANHRWYIGNTLFICFLNVSLHRKTVVVLYQARTFIYLWIVDRLYSISLCFDQWGVTTS